MSAPGLFRLRNVAKGPIVQNDPETGCLIWQGSLDRRGYGGVRRAGKLWSAHRYAWWLANGDIPPGMYVLHRCDTPACVRPSHLFLGTQGDNMRDAKAKGRLATGERGLTCKRGHSKAQFYRRYPAGGRSYEECRRVRRAEARTQ